MSQALEQDKGEPSSTAPNIANLCASGGLAGYITKKKKLEKQGMYI